jgi:protein-tyrosine phosphatase
MYQIDELSFGPGWLGIGPMPGRSGRYDADLNAILKWGAGLVLTMTTAEELKAAGAAEFGRDLELAGVEWHHLPVPDFGAPPDETLAIWPDAAREAAGLLASGGRVFAHCFGGCGRSGMALMRLMVESGEDAGRALERLRETRPCAVETEAQKAWASQPMFDRLGTSS